MTISWLRRHGAAIACEALGLMGFALFEAGIAAFSRAIAMIVGGILLMGAAFLLARRG